MVAIRSAEHTGYMGRVEMLCQQCGFGGARTDFIQAKVVYLPSLGIARDRRGHVCPVCYFYIPP
jgi:hypothetical protein